MLTENYRFMLIALAGAVLSFFAIPADCRAADTTAVRGFAGEVEGGWSGPWYSHLGYETMFGVRQTTPELAMKWRSAPLPARIDSKSVTFVWTGAFGMGPAYAGNFTIYVNGRAAADFDTVVEPTRFISRAKGCELVYASVWTYWSGTDSSGYFYLTVPASWVKPGEPAVFEAKAKDVGLRRWFALQRAEDAPMAVPEVAWSVFTRRAQPALPPPPRTEASYDWYLPQYTDPGMFTPIGPPGDPAETAVTPTGQLITCYDNMANRWRIQGTLPPWIRNGLAFAICDGLKIVPVGAGERARQSLMDGCLPVVITSWKHGALELRETAFAEPLAAAPYSTGQESTLAWAAFAVTNRSSKPEHVALLAFIADQPLGLTFKGGVVLMNGSALFSAQAPPGFSVEFAPVFPTGVKVPEKDPLELLRNQSAVFDALVVRGRVAPGKTVRIAFNRVFGFPGTWHWQAKSQPPVAPEQLTGRRFDASLKKVVAGWGALANAAARFKTPDARLNRILTKAVLDGHFLTKRWDGRHIVFDSVTYRCQWDDASTKWFYALDLMGDHRTAQLLLDTVFERQGQRKPAGTRTHEGCFSDVTNIERDGSDASWGSCNGWALWAMAEHARLTNDPKWIENHKSKILAGCEWIIRERSFSKEKLDNPCAGLLYGKFVCDMPGGEGYFAYQDAVSYLGLQSMARLLSEWGHPEAKRLLDEAEAYRQDIIAACDRLTDRSRDPWYVPWMWNETKNENRYLYDVVGPINLAFGGVLSRDDERISHVIRWIIDHTHGGSIESATAGISVANEGAMFYSQDLAIVLLELGRVEDFLRILYTLLASNVSHETYTTCEWRSNTQPHIHSISSLVRMVRTMLVEERDGGLYLLQGTPRRWLEDGNQIRIDKAPTWYGPLSLSCVSNVGKGLVQMRLRLPERIGKAPVHIRLRLPTGLHIKTVTVNGQRHREIDRDWIVLRGLKGDLAIEVRVTR